MMAFCAVSFGGCGGSSTGSITGSEDVYVPETPNTSSDIQPAPAPDTTPESDITPNTPDSNTDGINGTWRIASGKITVTVPGQNITANYIQGSASAQQFTISVSKNTHNQYHTIALSGNGVDTSELVYGIVTARFGGNGKDIPEELPAVHGSDFFEANGNGNGYVIPQLVNDQTTISYQLMNDSTINYSLNNHDSFIIDLTLTRVN